MKLITWEPYGHIGAMYGEGMPGDRCWHSWRYPPRTGQEKVGIKHDLMVFAAAAGTITLAWFIYSKTYKYAQAGWAQ
jgi:hypothetical protein